MNQRPRSRVGVFHRIVWMVAVPVAGCGSATPAVGNDAGSDVGPTGDRQAFDTGAEAGTTGGSDAGASPASTRAAITGDAGTTLDAAIGNVWITEIVTATTADGGVSADDPAGFFVQDGTGAIFVAVDPATISPTPQRGDLLVFRATRGEVHDGAKWITALTGYYRAGTNPGWDLAELRQDVSTATDLVSNLGGYEHHLVRVQGTIAGDFAGSGAGFEAAQITTAGVPVATANLVLRVPVGLRSGMNLRTGCTFTTLSPLWRNNAQAQVHVWIPAQLTLGGCPGDPDAGTPVDVTTPMDTGTPTDVATPTDVGTTDVLATEVGTADAATPEG